MNSIINPKNSSQRLLFLLMLTMTIGAGCTSEFDLELDKNEQRLVVEGWITNLSGPQLLRLTKTTTIMYPASWNSTNIDNTVVPVTDALVIVHDNTGIIDTLKPKAPTYQGDYYQILNGYYESSKLQGVPGRTYSLYIKAGGKEYSAKAYMPPIPAIDTLTFIKRPNPIKEEFSLVPTISFKEPQDTRNYFLFRLDDRFSVDTENKDSTPPPYPAHGVNGDKWIISILSDELLPEYVRNFPIDDGVYTSSLDYYYLDYGSWCRVNMYSLTKEAFEYHKALLAQFNNDGGVYQPAPASPPTNISNGAVGFFGASAVSYKVGQVE